MATKGNKKTNYEANEAFLQYEEEIVAHPAYAGMKKLNATLIAALSNEERIDTEIEAFLSTVDYAALMHTQEFIDVKELLKQIMELVAQEISSNWDDPRYSREAFDE